MLCTDVAYNTLEECNRARVTYLSPSTCSRPLSFCSMCYEQLPLSHRPSLQSLTSIVVGEMLRQSENLPRDGLVSRRLVLDRGMKIVYEPLLDGTRSHCCPCSTSELTANFFWTAAVVAVDRLPRSMMLQFSFVCVRRHFVPMVPPAVITIRMHTL